MRGGIALQQEFCLSPLQEERQFGISREAHKRSCFKKTISQSERQSQAFKMYLMDIGITWPAFQKMHTRLDVQRRKAVSNRSISYYFVYKQCIF